MFGDINLMKKIVLHGALANHIPNGEFECDFARVSEAVSAIEANWPGFYDLIRNQYVYVVPGDDPNGAPLDSEQVPLYKIGASTLHIVPSLEGAGGNNRGVKAILGLALIAVSFGVGGFVAGGLGSTAAIAGTSLGITGTQLLFMGAGLVLQALVQPPKPPTAPEREVSSFYSGPLNSQQEGSIVPYAAGRDVIVGGVIIHTDLVVEQKI